MTGCVRGVVSRLCRDCDYDVFWIWCSAHQLDLVMKRVFHNLLDDKFVTLLTAVTGHLLTQQQNLITKMKRTCPAFVETHWIILMMGKPLKWLKDNQICLVEHFDRKQPRRTPAPVHGWIVDFVIQAMDCGMGEKNVRRVTGIKHLGSRTISAFVKVRIQHCSLSKCCRSFEQ